MLSWITLPFKSILLILINAFKYVYKEAYQLNIVNSFLRPNPLNPSKAYSHLNGIKCQWVYFTIIGTGNKIFGAQLIIPRPCSHCFMSLPFMKRVLSLWINCSITQLILLVKIGILLHNLVEENRVTSSTAKKLFYSFTIIM